jgi:hypothetical protein
MGNEVDDDGDSATGDDDDDDGNSATGYDDGVDGDRPRWATKSMMIATAGQCDGQQRRRR